MSPFLFSCMAISKLLCRILLSVLIQSSISASLSAASRYVLLSCIFSSKANRRTLLFCSHNPRGEGRKKKEGAKKQTNYFKFHIAEENRTTKHRLSVTDIRKFYQAHKVYLKSNDRLKRFSFSHLKIKYPTVDKVPLKECFISLSKANIALLPAHPKAESFIIKS